VKKQKMFYPEKFIQEQVPQLSGMIGEEKAVIPVSGGVGSTISAVLTHRAVNDQAIIVLIDDGMQLGKAGDMMNFYATQNMNTKLVDASHEFSGALNGIDEPTEQRKTYRDTYYAILERIIREEKAQYLVQGTTATNIIKTEEGVELQDDVLEQVGIRVIDSRKNGVTVIEPLKKLNRHEVLKVAQHLELPPELSTRKPFPDVLNVIRASLVK
jgi:GMP synthase (glutamine-hydrolysing)